MKGKFLSVILIFCLGSIVYSNTFHCSFHLDDFFSITGNYVIKNISDLQGIWNYWPCRFVTYYSIAVNYYLNGFNVSGYHFFNLAVHLLSAVLVWWLTRLTLSTPVMKDSKIAGQSDRIALFAGLIFVSHPIQTQAVTYIVQRAASMTAMFYVASLCFYVKARSLHDRKTVSGPAWFYFTGALIMAAMAMFTKETAITLPLMVLLYEFCFLRKEGIEEKGTPLRMSPFPLFFLLTILIIPLTMFLTKTVNFQEMHRASEDPQGISSLHYLLTQFRVITTYLRLLFIPLHQNVDYDYPISQSFFELPVLLGFLFLAAILFLAQRLFLKYRLVSFSIFAFFLTLLPESSFIPIKDVIFEHRLYLPMVGYSLFLVSGMYYLICRDTLKGVPTMCIILTMIVLCFSVLTYQRNKIWKDENTLWTDTISKSPHKARAYDNRGKFYLDEGKLTLAMADFNKAIGSDPKDALAYNNRGCVYGKQGDPAHALLDFDKGIKLDPRNPFTYADRGFIYYGEDKLALALLDMNKSIELNPNYADAYDSRGLIYNKLGRLAQAFSDYNKAIELDPNFAQAYDNRGVIYFDQGNYTQALSDYNTAIALNPNYGPAYNDEGTLEEKQKNFAEAMADYSKAITLNSKSTESYYNLGNIYYHLGGFSQARADYTKAIEVTPSFAQAYYNRGNAYIHLENIAQAMADFTMAIKKKPDFADAYSARGQIYATQGNLTQAISDLTKSVELNPKDSGAYFNRGLIYANQGKSDQAISDFTKAIALDPASAGAFNDRGFVYASQGNFTQALADYNKAIELNPKFETTYSNRAVLYYKLKEYDKAWGEVHQAQGLGATISPEFLNALAQASGQQK